MNIYSPLNILHHHLPARQHIFWGLPLLALVFPGAVAEARVKSASPSIATPIVAEPMIDLARAALDRGQAAAAVTLARQALAGQPNDRGIRSLLADALLASGDAESAVALYRALAAEKPDDNAARSGLGLGLLLLGQDAEAIDVLKEAIASRPSPDILSNIAFTLALAGRAQEAVAVLEPLVKAPTSTVQQRQNLAFALALTGERARAYQIAALDLDIKTALREVDAWFVDGGQPLPLKLQKYAGLSLKTNPTQRVAAALPKPSQTSPATSVVTTPAAVPTPGATRPVPAATGRPALTGLAVPVNISGRRATALNLPLVSAPIEVEAPAPSYAASLAAPRPALADLTSPIKKVPMQAVAVTVPAITPPVEVEAPAPSYAASLAAPRPALADLTSPIKKVPMQAVAVTVPAITPPVEVEAPAPSYATQLASPRPSLVSFAGPVRPTAPALSGLAPPSLQPAAEHITSKQSPAILSVPAPVLAAAVQFSLPRPAPTGNTPLPLGNPRLGQAIASQILPGRIHRAHADSDVAAYAAIVPAAGAPHVTPHPLFVNEATAKQVGIPGATEQATPVAPPPAAPPAIATPTHITIVRNEEVVLEPVVFHAHKAQSAPVAAVGRELVLDTITIVAKGNPPVLPQVPTVVAAKSAVPSATAQAETLARITPASDGVSLLNILARAHIGTSVPVLNAEAFTRAVQGCATLSARACATVSVRF